MSSIDSLPMPEQRAQIKVLIQEDPQGGWEKAWTQGVTPWDAGDSQPPLRDVLTNSGISWPRTGRALVPGAGRGYDAVLIAQTLGLDTIAADISPTAIDKATSFFNTVKLENGKVIALLTDFFKYEVQDTDRFNLVYDYTFFVAIPPSRRPEWGAQMAKLVAPGGYLITLMFPLLVPGEPIPQGPPNPVSPEIYAEVLREGEWEKVLDEVPRVWSGERHQGKERIAVWRRK